jgi:hypothetical protein
MILPFILIAILFPLWDFANDITNPMGSIIGMFVASMVILVNLNGTSENARRALKAASEGVPVYTQVVARQLESAENLETIISGPGFEFKKRLLRKAMEESGSLHQTPGR